jgi:two-component system, NtrC family, sensor kinase
MTVLFILALSIALQFTAAFLALRLVWVVKKSPAWVLLALAISLMAVRRGITFYQLLWLESRTPLDQTTELVALAVSILMVLGISRIAPLFATIKTTEDGLRQQVIQTCMDGIIANDVQGNIITFNHVAERIFDYRRDEVLGKINVRDLYPPVVAHEIREKIDGANFGGKGVLENYETNVRHRDGTLIPIFLTARVFYEDGQEVGVVGHFRDLRERKRLEEELLRSERLSALGRMAAHISHEIKNPLMVIGGFARQVLKNYPGDPQKNQEKLQIMVDEIQRLEAFLVEVGGYAKISEPHLQPGDLNALAEEICARLQPNLQEHHVDLRLELDRSIAPVSFDPVHLRQVILNIAKNAIEAMPGGGTLTMVSGSRGGRVFLEIADTGEGIPPEAMDKIFQPFFSTKDKGSGLGLAISRKIMEAHQGEIAIASQPRQGTRVTLLLPAGA